MCTCHYTGMCRSLLWCVSSRRALLKSKCRRAAWSQGSLDRLMGAPGHVVLLSGTLHGEPAQPSVSVTRASNTSTFTLPEWGTGPYPAPSQQKQVVEFPSSGERREGRQEGTHRLFGQNVFRARLFRSGARPVGRRVVSPLQCLPAVMDRGSVSVGPVGRSPVKMFVNAGGVTN